MKSNKVDTSDLDFYDLSVDKEIAIGSLNEEGWWTLDKIQFTQMDESNCVNCNGQYQSKITIQSYPSNG